MMEFSILLTARAPERNIWRSYQISVGRDLLGEWIVETTYGRMGSRGNTRVVTVANREEALGYVRHCLKKRASAPKRIGIRYQVVGVKGTVDFSEIDPERESFH